MFDDPTQPSLAGYLVFIRSNMGIGDEFLPDSSPYIGWSYNQAKNIVSLDFVPVAGTPGAWGPYALAVYNLAGHILIEQCPDQSYTIGAASWAANLATITTTVANAIGASQVVKVFGVSSTGTPTGYNGTFSVAAKFNANQLGYAVSPNPGPATVVGATISETFFFTARRGFKIAGFVPGVVSSAGDQGTSTGLVVPESLKNLSLADLQYLKTPYGRAYLSVAMRSGPNSWGLT